MLPSLLKYKASEPKSVSFKTNTSVAIQTIELLHTSVVKSSKLIIICLRMEPGSARLEKKIKSLLSQPKVPNFKWSLISKLFFCHSSQNIDQPSSEINANGGKRHGKKDGPYTVAEWGLTKKEDTFTSNGNLYQWCTGDLYSVGTKYNGIYADHKSCDHDAWQARFDARCNARTNEKTSDWTSKPADAPTQKLSLNDMLWNSFCTQAGSSAEAVNRIWQDAQGNK